MAVEQKFESSATSVLADPNTERIIEQDKLSKVGLEGKLSKLDLSRETSFGWGWSIGRDSGDNAS